MEYRKLGNSDLSVSSICMGCWTLAGGTMWGERAEAESIATLHAAVDSGITFFDSAEAYGGGLSEQIVGKAFKGMRDKIVLATKVSQNHLAPKDLREACERSLKNLDMDYIDVYYLHWPSRTIPLADTLGEMDRLKDEGKIRHVGVSNFAKLDLTEITSQTNVIINQLPYNLLFRSIEHEVVPVCLEHNVGIACYSPLLHGVLAGKYDKFADVPDTRGRTRHFSGERSQVRHGGAGAEAETEAAYFEIRDIAKEAGLNIAQMSLAWLLHQPAVATVIAGASKQSHIESNAAAAAIKLSDDVLAALNKATQPLKELFGTNCDMWDTGDKARMR